MLKVAAIGAGAALLLAGCAAGPGAAPAPAAAPPAPAPIVAAPEPTPPAPPQVRAWEDQPLTPGDWRYAAGPPAAAGYGEGPVRFSIRCDPGRGQVLLARPGAVGMLTIRTSFGSRDLALPPQGELVLPASDPFLDDMVFSRGRVAVEAPGQPPLILPTWPEPARVIEECRP